MVSTFDYETNCKGFKSQLIILEFLAILPLKQYDISESVRVVFVCLLSNSSETADPNKLKTRKNAYNTSAILF